jgi:hypothetical protein
MRVSWELNMLMWHSNNEDIYDKSFMGWIEFHGNETCLHCFQWKQWDGNSETGLRNEGEKPFYIMSMSIHLCRYLYLYQYLHISTSISIYLHICISIYLYTSYNLNPTIFYLDMQIVHHINNPYQIQL